MSLHDDAVAVLRAWATTDPGQARLRSDYLAFLDQHDDAMSRECLDGHLTASALVTSHDRSQVLLTLHPKVGRWLQMGGHCEPDDASLRAAAGREALEESGISGLRLTAAPIHLDRHSIRCRPGVVLDHLDVQYLAVAPPGAVEVISDESLDLRWFGVDELPTDTDDSVRQLVAVARTAG